MDAEVFWMIAGIAAVSVLWVLLSLKSRRPEEKDEHRGPPSFEEGQRRWKEDEALASRDPLE